MSFLRSLPPHGHARDAHILAAIAAGRLTTPRWYRLRMGRVELDVSFDYLAIDGEHVPMAAPVAQAAVDSLDALLPTPEIVEAIEAEARRVGRVVPFVPWPRWQDDSQLATETIRWREANIAHALGDVAADTLVAGCLKDVVIAPRLASMPDRVLIFGGLYANGKRVQELQTNKTAHWAWFDGGYAHGVRAVRRACLLDGKPALLDDVLAAGLCGGPVARLRYETPIPEARPTPTISAVLRRSDRGPQVVELQTLLAGAGHPCQIDGIFGEKTAAAVIAFQRAAGLAGDGIAGPRTMTALRGLSDTDRPPPDVPPALSDEEIDDLFGPMLWTPAPTLAEPGAIRITNGWQKANLRRVVIPQLVGVAGAPKDGAIFLHRLVAEQTRALWAAWEKAGLLPLVLSWAGSWNPRLVRGGSTLSRHAYAVSWDVNAAWNPLGKAPAPRGAKGSVVELVPLAVEHGYTNGMNWSRSDPMHWEVVRVL